MKKNNTSELKAITILHLSLLLGQLFFCITALILVYINKFHFLQLQNNSQEISAMCVVAAVTCYLTANSLFTKKLQEINENYKPLEERLNDYRAVSILRWAIFEFAVLLCIILFLITSNYVAIVIAGLLMLVFLGMRPTSQKISSQLGISQAEIKY